MLLTDRLPTECPFGLGKHQLLSDTTQYVNQSKQNEISVDQFPLLQNA